jgi:hypothetical protein
LDSRVAGSNLRIPASATPDEILQKIVYHGVRANIQETWVANRRVHRHSPRD